LGVRAASECEVGEDFWKALIEDETVVTAGLVAERASEPTLADADWAAQNDIVVRVDKAALGERVVELALVRWVLLFPPHPSDVPPKRLATTLR
jgi:hypothetical protein